jgi:hypothetical protein
MSQFSRFQIRMYAHAKMEMAIVTAGIPVGAALSKDDVSRDDILLYIKSTSYVVNDIFA